MTIEVIQQQIDYYRNRATEYDEWFYRIGRSICTSWWSNIYY